MFWERIAQKFPIKKPLDRFVECDFTEIEGKSAGNHSTKTLADFTALRDMEACLLAHTRLRRPPYTPMYGHTYSKSMDQPGKVANPARGQLNREN